MEQAQEKPSYEELESEIAQLRQDYATLLSQFQALQKHVFGRRTEKLSAVSDEQLGLFEGEELPCIELEEESTEVPGHTRSKRNGRAPLDKDLPRQRKEYSPEETHCSCCDEELVQIGEDITEELEYQPARFFIREHVRPRLTCSKCLSEGVFQAKLPPEVQVIEKGRAGAGLLAYLIVAKYCDHLPLNRLEQIFAREGMGIAKSTLCDWVNKCAELLEPVYKELLVQILTHPAIYADETTLKVQDREKEGGLHQGYLWGALAPPGVYFHYSKSRAQENALELFSEYKGFVHTDYYAGYNPVFLPGSCERVGCWAHVRRKFVDVQKLAPSEAGKVLKMIAELYKVEKAAKKLSPEERLQKRQNKSAPILEKLEVYLEALNQKFLPQHPLIKAVKYALSQWEELTVYTTNPVLDIDNNPIERQIRPIAVGRKNYLFAGSHRGAKTAAIFYSLINSCKMHGVNPFQYLQDILRKVHTHPAKDIQALLPIGWKKIH